ncbi:MAG: hypothetical protein K5891_06945 [Lachnospiraceae bacterium]|nr:hypothetical protein [Lachnospiraceae bacterium]
MDDLSQRVNSLVRKQEEERRAADLDRASREEYCRQALLTENLPEFSLPSSRADLTDPAYIDSLRELKDFFHQLCTLLREDTWIRPDLTIWPDAITLSDNSGRTLRYTHIDFGIAPFAYRYKSPIGELRVGSSKDFAFCGYDVQGEVKLTGLFGWRTRGKLIQTALKSIDDFEQKAIAPYEHVRFEISDGDDSYAAYLFKDGVFLDPDIGRYSPFLGFFKDICGRGFKKKEDVLVALAADLITHNGSVFYRGFGFMKITDVYK